MPPNKNSPQPKVMTWPRAWPMIIGTAVFDLVRAFFQFFWFFGPALGAIVCTAGVNTAVGASISGVVGKVVATGCSGAAVVLGSVFSESTTVFGVIVADALGLFGFLALKMWMYSNARRRKVLKEMWLLQMGSFMGSLIPFIGAFPFYSFVLFFTYKHQIKIEKADYKKWEKETENARLQQQNQQAARVAQIQAAQQTRVEQEQIVQQETVEEESNREEEISVDADPTPIQYQPVARPEKKRWSPDSGVPPPMTPEYGWRTTPPPLPQPFSIPPPLPTMTPPPLPTSARMTPPPLPPTLPIPSVSGMKERSMISSDERSVEQVALRNNAFIVHTIAESGQAQHHNENSNVSGKATYGDDMDIMLAFEPSVSASSVTPSKKAQLWTGDGFLLGGGQISEAGGSDQGTIAHGIKKRGNRMSSLEEIDNVIGRNSELHQSDYERVGTFGMNEIVVNNSEVFGYFQQAGKDKDGHYWMLSTETKKDSEMAKKMRKYGETSFDKNMENYRRRFATAQERGIPLYIMTPDREVYEYRGVNDDGTVEVGKQLTPEEVARGRAGLSTEKRKEIGEKLLEKKIFRGEKTQKEAEEIIKSL
ncbi:MAG: hypothetical protein NUV60_00220 [Patescibacteria group bacterium]|nr:hypothetical protein [Patescibacteria group bacterium]